MRIFVALGAGLWPGQCSGDRSGHGGQRRGSEAVVWKNVYPHLVQASSVTIVISQPQATRG